MAEGQAKPRRPPPIIVKKITMVAAGHHGGAWKVAYADFVTAMMAFFLLLWLLGATTEKQRKGIADYFAPTLVKTRQDSAGSNKGLLGRRSSLTDATIIRIAPGQTGEQDHHHPARHCRRPERGRSGHQAVRAPPRSARCQAPVERTAAQARQQSASWSTPPKACGSTWSTTRDFSMFRLGTTILTPDAANLLHAIAEVVRDDPGGLAIRGHTDALPWRQGIPGNNWALSAGRAEATREALMGDGIAEDRFRRIEGVADRELLVPRDPHDPRNRRISVTVMP